MSIKLVIFDLDGTLVDTIEGLAVSMNAVLEARSLPTHSIQAYKSFIGNGLKNLVLRALPEIWREEKTINQGYMELLVQYRLHFKQGLSVYPGIGLLLDELAKQEINLGVNTNKNQEMTDWIVTQYLSKWSFVKVIGAQAAFENKPHPSAALSIAKQVGLTPEECLFVGDSEVDYQTAKNAGMKCVLVTWGFRTEAELLDLRHEYMIHAPVDLLKYL